MPLIKLATISSQNISTAQIHRPSKKAGVGAAESIFMCGYNQSCQSSLAVMSSVIADAAPVVNNPANTG